MNTRPSPRLHKAIRRLGMSASDAAAVLAVTRYPDDHDPCGFARIIVRCAIHLRHQDLPRHRHAPPGRIDR